MFSSLASFIFGSNTPATTNREVNQNPTGQQPLQQQQDQQSRQSLEPVHIDIENTIEVTSSTPSVTGAGRQSQPSRRGKNNKRNKNKRQGHAAAAAAAQGQGHGKGPQPTLTQLLTPNGENIDEDFDDDDWFIVEKEDDEDESLPRTDSEEELPIGQRADRVAAAAENITASAARQRRPNVGSHSLYNGPRPHQQRNYLQRARNSGARNSGQHLNVSALSPPRSIAGNVGSGAADGGSTNAIGAGGITQSLYVAPSNRDGAHSGSGANGGFGANPLMEESWFVTPPPCFTSIGPIHMETSPFENLLIEHPSMSVYRSIRSAQEATESFVNLDLGVEESQQRNGGVTQLPLSTAVATAATTTSNGRNYRAVQARMPNVRVDRFAAVQLKQELLARQSQKSHDKKERQNLCRGAMKRANKARDLQGRGHRQRRADMQHCKIISGANNNRKCAY